MVMQHASDFPRRPGTALCAIALSAALTLGGMGNALAQTAPQPAETEQAPAETQPKTLPPAYEAQMLRLSEALGALHYLRNLCGADEGALWRDEMQKLIDAEQPDEQQRAQMIASFNRGFRGYAEIHLECNEAAIEAANSFLAQGTRLTAEIPNRYGR
ncbi:MAG: TIGR02301 family protein [Nitratireductor sp.]|nr:TIGR02301 family protein [Nitratireductor sp.]